MGPRPPPQGARPGRRLSLLPRRLLRPGAALLPLSLRPLAAPPTASPSPFLRAHFYLFLLQKRAGLLGISTNQDITSYNELSLAPFGWLDT